MIVDNIVDDKTHPIMGAVLHMDLDMAAERFALVDRQTMRVVTHKAIIEGVSTLFVPAKYARSPSLMVIILDDDAEYNAGVADHLQALFMDMK